MPDRSKSTGVALGILGGVGLGVGASAFGDAPDPRRSTEEIAAYFVAHGSDVFIGVVLVGLSLMAVLGVTSRVAVLLDRADRRAAARLVSMAMTAAVTVAVAGMLLPDAALSYVIGAESPSGAKPAFVLTILTASVIAVPLATAFATIAVCAWQTRVTSRWFACVTGIAALAFVVSACSYARSDAFSPDVQQQVVFQTLIIWMLVSGFGIRTPDTAFTTVGSTGHNAG